MQPRTQRQRDIYEYITRFIERHGYEPSYAQIARHFGVSSKATIAKHIEALERRGLVSRHRTDGAFGLTVQHEELDVDSTCEVPLLGRIAAGALQPPVTRRLMTPLPPRPPTTKPALIIPGKTATASALSSKSFGMERSGAPMICSKTRDAFSDFFDAFLCCFGEAVEAGFVAVRSLSPCRAKSVGGIASAAANKHAARRVVRDESFIHSLLMSCQCGMRTE